MPHKDGGVGVRFEEQREPAAESAEPQPQQPRRRLQRPHTAAVSAGAPFLDASGNRTQPSRDEQLLGGSSNKKLPPASSSQPQQQKKKRRKKRRPKTAIGIEQQQQRHHQQPQAAAPGSASSPGGGGGGGSEPNFPTLHPRVFHALRGFLSPESLRKTKFYADREERMSQRRGQLGEQQRQLGERIGTFYRRLDSFIEETNAAAKWEPESQRKQKSLLDDLDNL